MTNGWITHLRIRRARIPSAIDTHNRKRAKSRKKTATALCSAISNVDLAQLEPRAPSAAARTHSARAEIFNWQTVAVMALDGWIRIIIRLANDYIYTSEYGVSSLGLLQAYVLGQNLLADGSIFFRFHINKKGKRDDDISLYSYH